MGMSVMSTAGPGSVVLGEEGAPGVVVEGRLEERRMVLAVGSWSKGEPMAGAEVERSASVVWSGGMLAVGPGPGRIVMGAVDREGSVAEEDVGAGHASETPATVGEVCGVESVTVVELLESWLISTGVELGMVSVCSCNLACGLLLSAVAISLGSCGADPDRAAEAIARRVVTFAAQSLVGSWRREMEYSAERMLSTTTHGGKVGSDLRAPKRMIWMVVRHFYKRHARRAMYESRNEMRWVAA